MAGMEGSFKVPCAATDCCPDVVEPGPLQGWSVVVVVRERSASLRIPRRTAPKRATILPAMRPKYGALKRRQSTVFAYVPTVVLFWQFLLWRKNSVLGTVCDT